MNTYMKHRFTAVLAAGLMVLGLGVWNEAQAAGGNPDTMTVTVTPANVNYAVTIASPEVQGYDFTAVTIGQTTIATRSIGVQNTGNIAEFFSLAVVDTTGGGVAWTNNTTNGFKTYVMQGLFQTNQPDSASFVGATNNVPGAAGAASNHWGQGTSKYAPLATALQLWLQLQMPSGVDDAGQHSLVLYINGQAS